MHLRALEKRALRKCVPVYAADFFFALFYATLIYVNSSFLSQFFVRGTVSLLFICGAIGSIVLYLLLPKLLRLFGNPLLFLVLLVISFASTLGMGVTTSPLTIAILFVVYASLPFLMFYSFDLFLESVSVDRYTGEIRGIGLTLANAAIAMAPLLVTALSADGSFGRLYIAAALILVPVLILWITHLRRFRNVASHTTSTRLPFSTWWKHTDIRRVTLARSMLEFFFSCMVIFTPVYLHTIIGFDWGTIGFIFAFMLLPFVLFELPTGSLADHWCGEKEIMSLGFFIMGIALLMMPFLGHNPYMWAGVLFLSRVGAAFIEITTDTYFFKQVRAEDSGLIALYRLSRPAPIILAAVIGGALYTASPSSIFIFLTLPTFYGLYQSARLVDTK